MLLMDLQDVFDRSLKYVESATFDLGPVSIYVSYLKSTRIPVH
jgi:hypothetical protein